MSKNKPIGFSKKDNENYHKAMKAIAKRIKKRMKIIKEVK